LPMACALQYRMSARRASRALDQRLAGQSSCACAARCSRNSAQACANEASLAPLRSTGRATCCRDSPNASSPTEQYECSRLCHGRREGLSCGNGRALTWIRRLPFGKAGRTSSGARAKTTAPMQPAHCCRRYDPQKQSTATTGASRSRQTPRASDIKQFALPALRSVISVTGEASLWREHRELD